MALQRQEAQPLLHTNGREDNHDLLSLRQRIFQALSHSTCLHRTGHIVKHIMSFLEETLEGALIGYGTYMLLSYNPDNVTEWGYILLVNGASFGAAIEFMEMIGRVRHQDYETYRTIKQAIAGALDGANFFQSFMGQNNRGVLGGYGVCLGLATMKSYVDLRQHRPFFRSRNGKAVKYITDGLYSLAMAAGIGALLFQLALGFNNNYVPPSVIWLTITGIAVTNLIATFVRQYSRNDVEVSKKYVAATIVTALFYGAALALFGLIGQLDIIDDTKPAGDDSFSNTQFGLVIAAAALFGTIASIKKVALDIQEDRYHQLMASNYHAHAMHNATDSSDEEDDQIELDIDEESNCRSRFSKLCAPAKDCVASFWHSNAQGTDESGYEQIDEVAEGCGSRIARYIAALPPFRPTSSSQRSDGANPLLDVDDEALPTLYRVTGNAAAV